MKQVIDSAANELEVWLDGNVAWMVFNNPSRHNALTPRLSEASAPSATTSPANSLPGVNGVGTET
jgi:enoyl-CoA hydratase/carnithine racemase